MSKVFVVADDLTGAAEMAGIGVEYGLAVRIARGPGAGDAEMLVLDTDSRAMNGIDAATQVTMAFKKWANGEHGLIYKKTDSVLRGQVGAEVKAMMNGLGKGRALLLPQNPSKGRVIVDGEYRINGIPLDQTNFRHDPESPITSARPEQILSTRSSISVRCVDVGERMADEGIFVGNGASIGDMRRWAAQIDGGTMPAGGADFFRALLEARGFLSRPATPIHQHADRTLIVCGSASDYSRNLVAQWLAQNEPVCPMPEQALAGTADERVVDQWAKSARELLQHHGTAVLAILHAIAPQRAADFRERMACVAERLISQFERNISIRLIVEGGATAAALAARLHWDNFEIAGNIAPGVVALRPQGAQRVLLIIKPGSYPWPAGLIQFA